MSELRIAVVDDDFYKREHMKQELDRSPHISVVHALDQDTAVLWSAAQWGAIDFAIVDIFDDSAPLEVGTDIYSGISALEHLRDLKVRTIAITPHRHHPLVEHRIFQSGANFLYRRWELNELEHLEVALLHPDTNRAPERVDPRVLRRYGADGARTNAAVTEYERSRLYGHIFEGATHRSVKVPRRTVEAFTEAIRGTGFRAPPPKGAPDFRESAKWADVRDYLLVLLGRKDSPPSNDDEHAHLWTRAS